MIIDVVIPYVDNTDKVWQKNFITYCQKYDYKHTASMRTNRFDDTYKLIDLQLKLINKFMPFVRTIHLLLSNIEQAPKDLPSNVKIHLHKEFIPAKYLPTFNSTTIEMFLWNIEDVSEYFIYANDDMIPIKPLTAADFYSLNGKIKMNFTKEDLKEIKTMFRYQCLNSYNCVLQALKMPIESETQYLKPYHTMTPMIKKHCKEIFDLLGDVILKPIKAFRTNEQHNQYIYPNYELLFYGVETSPIDFFYTEMKETVDEIFSHQIICVNKVDKTKIKDLKERLIKLCE